jgi:N-acetylglucosamine kinase-like BadF-type ATPase
MMTQTSELLICGVDAGATKTDCAICDCSGQILARIVSGPSAMISRGETLASKLARTVDMAHHGVPVPRSGVDVVVIGLAGVDTPSGHERAYKKLRAALGARLVIVENDAANALEAAAPERPAAVVMAGTGSIAYAEDSEGRTYRVGGWGHVFGDEGSGFAIGVAALSSVLRAEDGRSQSTSLAGRACTFFDLATPHALVDLTETFAREPSLAAGFASEVFAAAEAGDEVAATVIEGAANDLVGLASRVLEMLGHRDAAVVLSGGLLTNVLGYSTRVAAGILAANPDVVIRKAESPPVVGALLKGLALAGRDGDITEVRRALVASFGRCAGAEDKTLAPRGMRRDASHRMRRH